ncbi:MAG TPA: MFS transporter [Streptosporangiaceae bacterium]|nr:MFS transporter [Streptosporangiaceae bacterium]
MSEPAVRPAPAQARTGGHLWAPALFVTGILALAFNLRGAITSLPPVFPELAATLHLSSLTIALLAATPVLCFAVFSIPAAPLARRFGEERVLLASLLLLAVGLLARGALPGLLLFPGTVLAGAAIALMNVLLPSLVKRRRPAQAGLLIGVYLLSLAAGAILGSLIAVPVFQSSGGSARITLGLWALPALAAVLAWLPQRRFRTTPAGQGGGLSGGRPLVKVYRHVLAWQVMGFMGLQSLIYYSALSWLPILLRGRGTGAEHAGSLLALMNFGNAVTALLAPMLAHRARDQRWLIATTVTISAVGLAGVWFAPLAGAPAWTLLFGLGQGAALGLAIYFTAARAPDPVTSASLSAFTQGAGYLVATAGPLLVGFLHASTGNWTVPVLVMLIVIVFEGAVGWQAGRARTLPASQPAKA